MSNIDPKIWGNAGWIFLRNIAKGYPDKPTDEDKAKYMRYFESIGDVLPCSTCRHNYKKHWNDIPINKHLGNKNSLYRWVNLIKNKSTSTPEQKKSPNKHQNGTRRPKSRTVAERIKRIKESRVNKSSSVKQCGKCSKK